MKIHIIYREMIINEINNTCPINKRGRPRKLNLESAINELFKLVRTGMQWREVRPRCG